VAGLKKILNVFLRKAPESDTIRLRGLYRIDKTITKVGVENSSTKLVNSNDLVIASAEQGKTRGQLETLGTFPFVINMIKGK
jgi:hypothetical protein